ncbi:hypothetical protein LTR66_012397 [Elasticomyces elasticus]|nr:hypothetical protein LTR66_012397 [Elasticomyces elasticus]KAK5007031.1 hypothetical protein LTR28_005761 [Elasticomyces elasticus]
MDSEPTMIGTKYNKGSSAPHGSAVASTYPILVDIKVVHKGQEIMRFDGKDAIEKRVLKRFSLVARAQLGTSETRTKVKDAEHLVVTLQCKSIELPTSNAMKTVFTWMVQNSSNNKPTLLHPPPGAPHTLVGIINVWAAMTLVGITVRQTALYHTINKEIYAAPLSAHQVRLIWESFPSDNPIVTRMVHSIIKFWRAGDIEEEEDAAMAEYSATQPELDKLFNAEYDRMEALDQREKRRAWFEQNKARLESQAKFQKLWEDAAAERAEKDKKRIEDARLGLATLGEKDVARLGFALQ